MQIWTCVSSPRNGSQNVWTRITNVNGASRLSNFWNFFVRRDPNDFLSRLVTTCLYHYDPETKQQSIECRNSGSPRPKKFRVKKLSGKFFASFFGIMTASSSLIIFQMAKLSTRSITHLCWCNWRTFWRKNAVGGKVTKGVLFLHDNAPVHRAFASKKKLAYLGFQCLHNPHYSPDLAPSDYHLFPGLKKNWKSPFFVWRGGHCCRGDLVGRTTLWFFFEWLAKLRTRS